MLYGNIVYLRHLEIEDLSAIMENWNSLELRQFLKSVRPFSRQQEEDFIRRTWKEHELGVGSIWGIIRRSNTQLIGTVGLHDITRNSRTSELGIAIWKPDNWSKGYGTEAMTLILDYGFHFLNLQMIYLRVIEYNERAQRAYKKLGFKIGGRFRRMEYFSNQYHDMIIMDLIKEEWREPKLLTGFGKKMEKTNE